MYECLSDHKLVDAFKKAKELNLEQDFIHLLKKELINRGITIPK
ncbi:sporulation histidine kinase inhibitor Sda [Aquibacillus sediminis]|nr:sporulation histidine kinase inhibitor Sda [Aquibacillus sediminis]